MERQDGGEVEAGIPSSSGQRQSQTDLFLDDIPRRPDAILVACRLLNICTATSLLLCALALSVGMIGAASPKGGLEGIDYFCSQVVRLYGIILALSLMLIETEWAIILRHASLLNIWVIRGLMYGFVASLTFKNTTLGVGKGLDISKSLSLYRSIATGALLVCAACYSIGGMLCIGVIRQMRQKREQELQQAEAAIEALDHERKRMLSSRRG